MVQHVLDCTNHGHSTTSQQETFQIHLCRMKFLSTVQVFTYELPEPRVTDAFRKVITFAFAQAAYNASLQMIALKYEIVLVVCSLPLHNSFLLKTIY